MANKRKVWLANNTQIEIVDSTDYDALAAELAKMIKARELSAEASATLRDESIAKNERIRALEAALRESGEQLRMGAYHVGELGMAWTATIVTPGCQKIQRTLKAAYQASLTALETPEAMHGRIATETADAIAKERGLPQMEMAPHLRSPIVQAHADTNGVPPQSETGVAKDV